MARSPRTQMPSVLWRACLGEERLGHSNGLCSTLRETAALSLGPAEPLTLPRTVWEGGASSFQSRVSPSFRLGCPMSVKGSSQGPRPACL